MIFAKDDDEIQRENIKRPNGYQLNAKLQSDFDENEMLSGTAGIDFEVKKISSKEEELLKKARDLENEMRLIRQAKIEVVVK